MPPASHSQKKIAVIIGAGPAGLTAAYEMLKTTDIHPIVVEADPVYVGGISKTVRYKGNCIDIGGHRFFSKSEQVMQWWQNILPIVMSAAAHTDLQYRGKAATLLVPESTHATTDEVMLLRQRISRIYYNNQFFPYPLKLNFDTLRKLGFVKTLRIIATYSLRLVLPRRPEKNLEDFFINRFGDELYETFFKTYTEKVWGKKCTDLSAEWGAQRIKGLSVFKAVLDVVTKPFKSTDIAQKNTETSLIEQFLYPKYGPGQLWEKVARLIIEQGGEIKMGTRARALTLHDNTITSVTVENSESGEQETLPADFVISTTSIKELAGMLGNAMPPAVADVAGHLEYRDFITVGVLIKKEDLQSDVGSLDDTWMYIHDPNVHVGRIQVFNNWSPYLVQDSEHIWLGMEYFCTEGDALWNKTDEDIKTLGITELATIGFITDTANAEAMVLRERKTYPVYAGAYEQFSVVRDYLNDIKNFFPVGRNGMHRYNNQDHSMLTAIKAVELMHTGITDKSSLWEINTEQEYHEEKDSK